MRATVDAAVTEIAGLAQAKSIEIEVEDRRQTRVSCFDRARMGQVAINLLSNAIKFSPQGGRIAVTLGNPDVSSLSVQIAGRIIEKEVNSPQALPNESNGRN